MNFPTLVYRTPGAHRCAGGSYDYANAQSEGQLEQLLSDGWFTTLKDAMESAKVRTGGPVEQPLAEPEQPQPAPDAESKIIRKWLSEKLTDGGIDHDEDMHEDELIFLLFCEFAEREAAAGPLEGGELNADGNDEQAGGGDGSDDNATPTRAELEAKAEELGIKFDGRTTDAGLLRRIAAELETGAE